MSTQSIGIVIPNFNGAHLLRRNLPSVLRAAAAFSQAVTVHVVDDGSSDNSLDVLRQEFPSVITHVHPHNKGFSEACLTGVRNAEVDLVLLLNSDVELFEGCLEKLVPYFVQKNTFAVCPLMLEDDGSVNRHSWNLRSFQRGYLKLVPWSLDAARRLRASGEKLPALYASGGSMLVDRQKFLHLGGFHPIYKPFYGEDFDLGMRAWYQGWPSYFEPEASLVHQSKGSIKDNFKRARVKQIRRRNRYFLEWTHTPLMSLLVVTLPFTLLQLAGELLTLDGTNLRGFANAISNLGEVLKTRREIFSIQHTTFDDVLHKLGEAKRKLDEVA